MTSALKSVLAAATGLLAATALLAQNPAGTPPAQNSNPAAGTRPGQAQFPTPLYTQEDVARSMSLTPAQIARLNQATGQLQAQYRHDLDQLAGLEQQQRTARTQELLSDYNKQWSKTANDIFNEQQRSRYQQLYWQSRGVDALTDADVQGRLKLTDQQLAQLRDLHTWNEQQLRTLADRAATAPDHGASFYNDYRRKRQDRMNQFLTPEQRQVWTEMTGKPYDFRMPQPNRGR